MVDIFEIIKMIRVDIEDDGYLFENDNYYSINYVPKNAIQKNVITFFKNVIKTILARKKDQYETALIYTNSQIIDRWFIVIYMKKRMI